MGQHRSGRGLRTRPHFVRPAASAPNPCRTAVVYASKRQRQRDASHERSRNGTPSAPKHEQFKRLLGRPGPRRRPGRVPDDTLTSTRRRAHTQIAPSHTASILRSETARGRSAQAGTYRPLQRSRDRLQSVFDGADTDAGAVCVHKCGGPGRRHGDAAIRAVAQPVR